MTVNAYRQESEMPFYHRPPALRPSAISPALRMHMRDAYEADLRSRVDDALDTQVAALLAADPAPTQTLPQAA
jgi:hypothetical protein